MRGRDSTLRGREGRDHPPCEQGERGTCIIIQEEELGERSFPLRKGGLPTTLKRKGSHARTLLYPFGEEAYTSPGE